ncbi:MAG: DUF397 domain-containing protein [Acidimicrobiales bacterium]
MNDQQHRPKWRKSTYSGQNGSCVQLADLGGGVAVRDSKLGDDSPVLLFTRTELAAFLAGAKAGEFDDLA